MLLVVSACLFTLSITVPLAWHRKQRQEDTVHTVQSDATHFSLDRHAPSRDGSAFASTPSDDLRAIAYGTRHSGHSLPDELGSPIEPLVASQPSPYAHLITTDGRLLVEPLDAGELSKLGDNSGSDDPATLNSAYLLDPPPKLPEVVAWPVPDRLQMRLAELEGESQTRDWANQVQTRLERLLACQQIQHHDSINAINAISDTIPAGTKLAKTIQSNELCAQVNRTVYDLQRRIDVWRSAHELSVHLPPKKPLVVVPVVEVARLGSSTAPATAMVDLTNLLSLVEQYEFDCLPGTGRSIADAIQILQNSSQADHQSLGNSLEQHYRNANFRVAFSSHVVNRLVPEPQTQCAPVDEYIMDTPVWGRSRTFTTIKVRLVPDPYNIRIGVEAWGRVNAQTTAESGSVQVHSNAQSAFVIQKLFLLDDEGLKAKRTSVHAKSQSQLVGVESRFDRVPILRNFVDNVAESRFEEMKDVASRETNMRIEREAKQHFDAQVIPNVQKAVTSFYQKVWEPLVRLGLEPTSIEKRTTEYRAINRLRVGSGIQLAAHTARPRAPSDSWASMQIHETVLNNGLQQLELDGKTLTLEELYRDIASRINRTVDEVPDTMPSNVYISFAAEDSIRVRCEDGKATLTMELAEVRKGKNHWRDLTIKGIYEPSLNGLDARLVRTGPILLSGHRLRTRDQVALRGVFSKLLSKSNQLQLIPDDLVNDPRLNDMAVTQATITDGWIGIALGPNGRRAAERSASAAAGR
ncbi:MAG TPA: hypothetical protein VMX74_12805 [Pirellulales bacterium]|nr:hypothetical protein [Pirellulales bacterium]